MDFKKIVRPLVKRYRESAYTKKAAEMHAHNAPLRDFMFNFYSQNGEDRVIAELFRRLGIKGGWMVEFGAWDGMHFSNTFYFIRGNKDFKVIAIEGDNARFTDLKRTVARFPDQIAPVNAFVSESGYYSLDNILARTDLPKDFELLSVDIDSYDYQLWKGLREYHPKIVIIEVNSSLPLETEQVHGEGKQGTSFTAMRKLGNEKGYSVVHHRGNIVFVRNDLLGSIFTDVPELHRTATAQDALFGWKR